MKTRIKKVSEETLGIPILLTIPKPSKFKEDIFCTKDEKDSLIEEEVRYRTDEVYRKIHALLLSGPQYYYSCSIDEWNKDFYNSLDINWVDKENDNWLVCLSVPKRFSAILEYWSILKLFNLKEEDVSTPNAIIDLDKRLARNRRIYKKKWSKFKKDHLEFFE